MGFGFAVSFVIFLILSVGLAWYTKNPLNGVILMGLYIVIKTIWKVLTE